MFQMLMISALILLVTLTLGFHIFRRPKILRNGVPLRFPPNTFPIVGNGLLFLQDRHKLFGWFTRCEDIFGNETFQIAVPSLPPGVVINDSSVLEYVMKNENIFGKGDFVKSRSWDLFGNGIINADGDLWKSQRKAGVHFLSVANLKILHEIMLPHFLDILVEELDTKERDQIVDLEHEFLELTTQLMGRMAYDMEMHANDAFSVAFDYASGATGERFQNPLWKFTEPITGQRFRNALRIVKDFGSQIVQHSASSEENHDDSSMPNSEAKKLSGSLITSLRELIPDNTTVADSALNYLSAGRDTVAQAMTWTLYLLIRHPKVTACLRDELRQFSQGGESGDVFDRIRPSIDVSALQPGNLPYTMATFYESLRLYPPVPFEMKQCELSVTLPDGTFLPKDSVLVWCTWAMNRSMPRWGFDAHEFRPERWIHDEKLVSKSAFEFPVFNGGARMCLGKRMAENIAAMVIAKLIWEFEFEPVESGERFSRNSLTLPMEGGLPVFVKRRE